MMIVAIGTRIHIAGFSNNSNLERLILAFVMLQSICMHQHMQV